jgi:chromosomal replication initiation ATPase DnaA
MSLTETASQQHEAKLAAALAAFTLGIDPDAIVTDRRGTDAVAWARQVSMYLMYVTSGLSLAKVAAAFGRDRSTVAHACRIIEDRREDPAFDAWVDNLQSVFERLFALRDQGLDKGERAR